MKRNSVQAERRSLFVLGFVLHPNLTRQRFHLTAVQNGQTTMAKAGVVVSVVVVAVVLQS